MSLQDLFIEDIDVDSKNIRVIKPQPQLCLESFQFHLPLRTIKQKMMYSQYYKTLQSIFNTYKIKALYLCIFKSVFALFL